MTDRLEREMQAMSPRPMAERLIERIDASLATAPSRRFADRMLIASILSGALAACVIFLTLLNEPASSIVAAPQQTPRENSPRLGDLSLALARAK